MPPQLEKNHVVPTSWQDEALARHGKSPDFFYIVAHLDRKAAALRSMNLCLLGRSPIQAAVSHRPQHKQKVPVEGSEPWLHRSIQWF